MSSIQSLLDEQEIIRALGRFARIIDQRLWPELPTVFAPDLNYNYGAGGEQVGIEALERTLRQCLDVCGATQHQLRSVRVDVSGDEATSRAYAQSRHEHSSDPNGTKFDHSGEYVDRWHWRPEGWRIVRRDVIWRLPAGDPQVLATDRTVPGYPNYSDEPRK